jgi:hypothetical protein
LNLSVFLAETNLSMMSSRSKSRSRSRSTSSNRTITSTSSIESIGEVYEDGSRSSSPINEDLVASRKRCAADNDTVAKKTKMLADEFKHSTPVLSDHQQKQKLIELHYSRTNTYAMAAAAAAAATQSFYANKSTFMTKAASPIASLKLLQQNMAESPISHDYHHQHHQHQSHKPLSLCAVCGDRASGKHYGVLSCDGCRGFFKRSIRLVTYSASSPTERRPNSLSLRFRGNMEYVCKESQKCVIDVSRRNQCQSCRLRKCLEVKMNKDGESWLSLRPIFIAAKAPCRSACCSQFDRLVRKLPFSIVNKQDRV